MAHVRRTSWVRGWFTLSVTALVLTALCGCGGSTAKVLYAVGPNSPNVTIFTVSTSGELTPRTDSVSTGSNPVAIAVDPRLRFAYVVDSAGGITPGGISQYTLNAGSGALAVATLPATGGTTSPSTPIETGIGPVAIAIDSTGAFVFVATTGVIPPNPACNPDPRVCDASIAAYTIDSTGGALTEVKQLQPPCTSKQPTPCPLPLPAAAVPSALASTGNMLFVAMASAGAGSVATYTFDSTGILKDPPTSITAAGTNPSAMAMDSSGKFLFVADVSTNKVAAFTIGSSGQLTAVGSPVDTGTTPVSVRVHPNGKFLFTANQGSNDVTVFSLDSSGMLTKMGNTPVAPGTGPSYVTTDASGSLLFVANRDSNNISVFSIDSSGALKAASGSPFPSVVIHPVALASIN
jgi:6-phosphogluconolactonase (cycloisomerase 2 family)